MQKCERCGANALGYELHDYCATCGKNLCDNCMEAGCCGHVPAISGVEADDQDLHATTSDKRAGDPGDV